MLMAHRAVGRLAPRGWTSPGSGVLPVLQSRCGRVPGLRTFLAFVLAGLLNSLLGRVHNGHACSHDHSHGAGWVTFCPADAADGAMTMVMGAGVPIVNPPQQGIEEARE